MGLIQNLPDAEATGICSAILPTRGIAPHRWKICTPKGRANKNMLMCRSSTKQLLCMCRATVLYSDMIVNFFFTSQDLDFAQGNFKLHFQTSTNIANSHAHNICYLVHEIGECMHPSSCLPLHVLSRELTPHSSHLLQRPSRARVLVDK